jgi:hypothetical protein
MAAVSSCTVQGVAAVFFVDRKIKSAGCGPPAAHTFVRAKVWIKTRHDLLAAFGGTLRNIRELQLGIFPRNPVNHGRRSGCVTRGGEGCWQVSQNQNRRVAARQPPTLLSAQKFGSKRAPTSLPPLAVPCATSVSYSSEYFLETL